MNSLDFRSDTLTLPTREMMEALNAAELGDAGRGDDISTNELEDTAAKITGKEAAIFVPSGTMGNLAAILTHTRPGQEIIVEQGAHIYNSEVGGMSAVAGTVARPISGLNGVLNPEDVRQALRLRGPDHVASTGLLCIENTLNSAGGIVIPLDRMAELYRVAHEAGLPVHLDGARVFNAAAALNVPVSEICRFADSVMFALCKGLGAPAGAILAGTADSIMTAKKRSKMLGGGMRQIGLLTAPALIALKDPYKKLRRDHAMARRLAEGLSSIDKTLVRLETVQTNIVNCHVDHFAENAREIVAKLEGLGIRANFSGAKIRFVTYSQIDEESVDMCLDVMRQVISSARKAA